MTAVCNMNNVYLFSGETSPAAARGSKIPRPVSSPVRPQAPAIQSPAKNAHRLVTIHNTQRDSIIDTMIISVPDYTKAKTFAFHFNITMAVFVLRYIVIIMFL